MALRTRVLPRALVMFLPRYINTSCSTEITHANERTHAVAGRRLGTTRWRGVVTIEIRLDERAKALQPPVRHTHAGLAKDVRPLHHIRRRSRDLTKSGVTGGGLRASLPPIAGSVIHSACHIGQLRHQLLARWQAQARADARHADASWIAQESTE